MKKEGRLIESGRALAQGLLTAHNWPLHRRFTVQSTEEDDDARTQVVAVLRADINHKGLKTSRSIVFCGRKGWWERWCVKFTALQLKQTRERLWGS